MSMVVQKDGKKIEDGFSGVIKCSHVVCIPGFFNIVSEPKHGTYTLIQGKDGNKMYSRDGTELDPFAKPFQT